MKWREPYLESVDDASGRGTELGRETEDSEGTEGVRISTEFAFREVNVMHPDVGDNGRFVMQLDLVLAHEHIKVFLIVSVDVCSTNDSWGLALSLVRGQVWSIRHASLQEGSYTNVSSGSSILWEGMSAIGMSDDVIRLHTCKAIGTVDSWSRGNLGGNRVGELWFEDLSSGRQLWAVGRSWCTQEDIVIGNTISCQYVYESVESHALM